MDNNWEYKNKLYTDTSLPVCMNHLWNEEKKPLCHIITQTLRKLKLLKETFLVQEKSCNNLHNVKK